jgi:hypothetical protein
VVRRGQRCHQAQGGRGGGAEERGLLSPAFPFHRSGYALAGVSFDESSRAADILSATGGNLFVTVATALDASAPLTNPYLATPCPNDVAGFPATRAPAPAPQLVGEHRRSERARLADQIQVRAYQVVPYGNGGQWKQ